MQDHRSLSVELVQEDFPNIRPLGRQIGQVSRKCVPDDLTVPLFGIPAGVTEPKDQLGTFAVLDGAKAPFVLTSTLEESGLRYRSLFQGEAQDKLGEYAPYLVELQAENNLCRKLFTSVRAMGLWEQNLGVFIRSASGFDGLRTHLRKFTRVQDEAGRWYYFRYWDPRILTEYLGSLAQREDPESHEKIASFFRNVIEYMLISDTRGTTGFRLVEPVDPKPVAFRITEDDLSIMSGARWSLYKEKLLRVLTQEHEADFRIEPMHVFALADYAYRRNFRTEIAAYNFVRSGLMLSQLGRNFEEAVLACEGGTPTEHARRLWNSVKGYLKETYHD